MPITVSYDLGNANPNQRNYVRSMLERFGWRRLGGSVFRYPADNREEDWMNDVIPSLMFLRSYVLQHTIQLRYFTLDSNSVVHLDHSDPDAPVGDLPMFGQNLNLHETTNAQSSEALLRRFVDAAIDAIR